jgi:hypothetical protein
MSRLEAVNRKNTNTSFLSIGPKAGSYRPPIVGLLSSSSSTEFVICLTDMRRTSWDERKENETLETVDGNDWEIFIAPENNEARLSC